MTNSLPSAPPGAPLGPVATPSRHAAPDGTRGQVLVALAEVPGGATVEELATALAIHANSVRNHVGALVESGLVDVVPEPPSGRGRPAHRYAVSVAGSALLAVEQAGRFGGGGEYRALAEAFAHHLATRRGAQREARAVGELWGAQVIAARRPQGVGARESVLSLLTDLGFAPAEDESAGGESAGDDPAVGSSAGSGVVLLRACPLLESAQQNPEVICQVHLGLVTGARTALGATDGAGSEGSAARPVRLEPFAQPGACRLTLPA